MISKSDTFRQLHDEALAEFCVIDTLLRARGSLATPVQFAAALRGMKDKRPNSNVSPFDRERFEQARLREIDRLIKRTELEIE